MRQPGLVRIFAAGSWRPAELLDWRTTDPASGEWRAYVTYTVGVGQKYLHWIDGEQVRRAPRAPDPPRPESSV